MRINVNRYQVRNQSNSWRHKYDLVRILVARDFKLRYKRSLLGIAWSLLVPLAQLLVLYVVFNGIVPLNIPHYTSLPVYRNSAVDLGCRRLSWFPP